MQDYAAFETIAFDGVEYVNPASCTFGDYGGNGSVGLSNIREIIKRAEAANAEVYETDFQTINYASGTSYFPFESEIALKEAVSRKRKPLVLHVTGGYSSETVYILRHSLLAHEVLSELCDYPSLDDEGVSAIESDWESEAMDSFGFADLERHAFKDDEPNGYDDMSDDDKHDAYRFAMEVSNTYPEPEMNGVYIDFERVAPDYAATVKRMLAGETIDAIQRKQWPSLYKA